MIQAMTETECYLKSLRMPGIIKVLRTHLFSLLSGRPFEQARKTRPKSAGVHLSLSFSWHPNGDLFALQTVYLQYTHEKSITLPDVQAILGIMPLRLKRESI